MRFFSPNKLFWSFSKTNNVILKAAKRVINENRSAVYFYLEGLEFDENARDFAFILGLGVDLTKLRFISLSKGCLTIRQNRQMLKICKKCPNLKSLDFWIYKMFDSHIVKLVKAINKKCPKLSIIRLENGYYSCQFQFKTIIDLFRNCQSLQTIIIYVSKFSYLEKVHERQDSDIQNKFKQIEDKKSKKRLKKTENS